LALRSNPDGNEAEQWQKQKQILRFAKDDN
jgi:hypothetical protein